MDMEDGNRAADNDVSYFAYYGQLTHQQNMLQDAVRTTAYHQAITKNAIDFKDKVVLDVGCGSGILSFFAAHAGARKVYAVEAAKPMATHARKLAKANGLDGIVEVIAGKLEEIELPEQVDVIISEPMGVLLVHERMLESFIEARERWLRPQIPGARPSPNQMYPATSTIHFAPFSDPTLYASIHEKARFWETNSFYGVDLSALASDAVRGCFAQPIVGGVEPKTLMASACSFDFDFTKCTPDDLQMFEVPLQWTVECTGVAHGVAAWFDVSFMGSIRPSVLSTAPDKERTHWHQVRLLFRNPVALNRGQKVEGSAIFIANDQRSYDIEIKLEVPGLQDTLKACHVLQDQQYWNLEAVQGLAADLNLDYLSLYPASI